MESASGQSPRKHVRTPFPARVEFAGETFKIEEFTANLSEGGVFLLTDQSLPLGSRGKLTFRISQWEEPFTVEAEVVHVVASDSAAGPAGLGMRFLDLSELNRRRFQRLVEGSRDGSVAEAIRRSLREEGGTLIQVLRRRPTDQKMMLALYARTEEADALIRDGHPQVLERLLENPRLTVPHVRAMLRDTRMTTRLLLAIHRKRTWLEDEEIRYLFCRHPRTPVQEALRLLPELTRPQLQNLLAAPSLQHRLRERVKAMVRPGAR